MKNIEISNAIMAEWEDIFTKSVCVIKVYSIQGNKWLTHLERILNQNKPKFIKYSLNIPFTKGIEFFKYQCIKIMGVLYSINGA